VCAHPKWAYHLASKMRHHQCRQWMRVCTKDTCCGSRVVYPPLYLPTVEHRRAYWRRWPSLWAARWSLRSLSWWQQVGCRKPSCVCVCWTCGSCVSRCCFNGDIELACKCVPHHCLVSGHGDLARCHACCPWVFASRPVLVHLPGRTLARSTDLMLAHLTDRTHAHLPDLSLP